MKIFVEVNGEADGPPSVFRFEDKRLVRTLTTVEVLMQAIEHCKLRREPALPFHLQQNGQMAKKALISAFSDARLYVLAREGWCIYCHQGGLRVLHQIFHCGTLRYRVVQGVINGCQPKTIYVTRPVLFEERLRQ